MKCEKVFGNNMHEPTPDTLCISQKGKSVHHGSSLGESSNHGRGRRNSRGRGEVL